MSTTQLSLSIPVHGYLADHRVDQRPVLPVVDALQLLARATLNGAPQSSVACSRDADFMHFLYLPPGNVCIDASAKLKPCEDGSITATLTTQKKIKNGSITRTVKHISVTFQHNSVVHSVPLDIACAPEGVGLRLRAKDLYEQIVPFGPAFHNATDPIFLSALGASSWVVCPAHQRQVDPLGSPFPLDAAFHVACAWGQRYMGTVTFPVGYSERCILQPTESGGKYFSRIIPRVWDNPAELTFDIWLFTPEGVLCEAVLGVRMKDVSRGKLQTPEWIHAGLDNPLKELEARVAALSVVEIAALAPFVDQTFTPRECYRYEKLGARRRPSYAAARLVCKWVARKLAGDAGHLNPQQIETVADDLTCPQCMYPGADPDICCSVAHDDRFALAAVATHPVGVDVERISTKALRGKRLFMCPDESDLTSNGSEDPQEVATRIWTIKEAAVKALDLQLTEAWHQVRVTETGARVSQVRIGDRLVSARHARIDDHLFTLLGLPG